MALGKDKVDGPQVKETGEEAGVEERGQRKGQWSSGPWQNKGAGKEQGYGWQGKAGRGGKGQGTGGGPAFNWMQIADAIKENVPQGTPASQGDWQGEWQGWGYALLRAPPVETKNAFAALGTDAEETCESERVAPDWGSERRERASRLCMQSQKLDGRGRPRGRAQT